MWIDQLYRSHHVYVYLNLKSKLASLWLQCLDGDDDLLVGAFETFDKLRRLLDKPTRLTGDTIGNIVLHGGKYRDKMKRWKNQHFFETQNVTNFLLLFGANFKGL